MISKVTGKSTCSPESAGGHMLSDSPVGTTTDLFGQEVVPAHRSRLRENDLIVQSATHDTLCRALDELAISYAGNASTHGLLIPAIYGRKCGDSSPSAALQSSLGNRLQVRMAECGLPEYRLRWKYWVLLLGQRICALRASARRTFDNDCGGWPTPQAMEAVYQSNGYGPNLTEAAKLAGWQTPKSSDGVRSTPRTSDRLFEKTTHLQTQVKLTGWATPRSVENGHGKGNPSRALNHKSRLEDQIYLAGWPTPDAQAMNVGCDPKRHLERLERLTRINHQFGNWAPYCLEFSLQYCLWPIQSMIRHFSAQLKHKVSNLVVIEQLLALVRHYRADFDALATPGASTKTGHWMF